MLINKNPQEIKNMFDKISNKYDFINNLISFFMHLNIKTEAIKALKIKNKKEVRVLDLCCGSGDLLKIVNKLYPNVQIFGVDFSHEMLKFAHKKCKSATLYEADATDLPFSDEYFDYILMGFGLRNIQEEDSAIREVYRILKKEGKFLHLDFEPNGDYMRIYDKIIPYLTKIFLKDISPYIYLLQSKNNFYTNDELIEKFEDFGFGFVNYKKKCFNMIAYQIMKKY